jgi:predicted negative regulator of RcsB-dependent stress response
MSGGVSRELYLELKNDLKYAEQGGDPFELGCRLYVLGIGELYHEYQMEKAEPLLKQSIKNLELVEDLSTQVLVFKTHGYLLLAQGKFAECYDLKRLELKVVQEIGDRRLTGVAHAEIGEVLCHLGKYADAEAEIRTGLALVKDRSEVEYAHRHRYLGDVLLAQGRHAEAREAYLFSYRFFQSLAEKGWMLTALTGLSRAEFALGDRPNAWLHAREAVKLYHEVRLYTFFAYLSAAEIALLLADRGELIQALELYSLVSRQGYLARSCWFADLFGQFLDRAAAQLPLEEQAAARERGLRLDFPETIASLLRYTSDQE